MKKNICYYTLLLILFSGILYAQIDSRGLKVKHISQAGQRWVIQNHFDQRPYIALWDERSGDIALTIASRQQIPAHPCEYIETELPAADPVLASPSSGTSGVINSPALQWNAATDATSHTLQVSENLTVSTPSLNQSTGNAIRITIKRLVNGNTYFWPVCSSGAKGNSGWSKIWNFTTEKAAQPEETKKEQPVMTGKQTPFLPKKGDDIAPEVVYIPAGEFMMGSDDHDSEKPVHRVKVDAYYIGKYEVTQREWIALMGSNPSYFTGDDLPVEKVSWDDIPEYLRKLSGITGKNWRLPTEAEWEYACRAGSTSKYCFGDNDSQLGEYAWYNSNSGQKTHPAGQKKPNSWGLYDMHGNVYEWCLDWYDEKYYANSPLANPTGQSEGTYRLIRGGGWNNDTRYLRSASRIYYLPSDRYYLIGFRCVREP